MEGLGDVVDYITTKTGIKIAVKAASKAAYDAGLTSTPDCGCNKRKAALNKAVPFNKQNKDG